MHCATSWIYDSVYSAYMLNIHTNIHMLYAKNTHWYILRIEPESHVVYFAYTRYYHVRLLWVCYSMSPCTMTASVRSTYLETSPNQFLYTSSFLLVYS